MKTYQETLDAVIRYIAKNGKTQDTLNRVEAMLPGVWAAELIADALDALA
jgi:thiaminase